MADETGLRKAWTPRRERLHHLLDERNRDLAALYAGVIDLLDDASPVRGRRQRLLMIAHGMRELLNNLPNVFDDVDKPATRSDPAQALRALDAAWEDERAALGEPGAVALAPDGVVTVRAPLLLAAADVVARHRDGTRNNRRRQAATALGRQNDGSDPTLKAWLVAQRWFESHAHLDRSLTTTRDDPTDADILARVEVIEEILMAPLNRFFAVMDEVADLLADANRRHSSSGTSSEVTD